MNKKILGGISKPLIKDSIVKYLSFVANEFKSLCIIVAKI